MSPQTASSRIVILAPRAPPPFQPAHPTLPTVSSSSFYTPLLRPAPHHYTPPSPPPPPHDSCTALCLPSSPTLTNPCPPALSPFFSLSLFLPFPSSLLVPLFLFLSLSYHGDDYTTVDRGAHALNFGANRRGPLPGLHPTPPTRARLIRGSATTQAAGNGRHPSPLSSHSPGRTVGIHRISGSSLSGTLSFPVTFQSTGWSN